MYEIEIKSLLGDKKKADTLVRGMKALDKRTKLVKKQKQLNHYFIGGNIGNLYASVKNLLSAKKQGELKDIIERGSDFSIRTREVDGHVRLVLKASLSDDTSANGVSRVEFDEKIPKKTLAELDELLLNAGFSYQAKWSRERKEYTCKGVTVCIDKNAGYGYVAEFEKMIPEKNEEGSVKNEIRELMNALSCMELAQDRLERMFAFYNTHWPEYYGTDKTFVIL